MLEIHPLTTDKLKYINRTRVQIRRRRIYHISSKIEITIVEIEGGFKITANDNVIVKTYGKM